MNRGSKKSQMNTGAAIRRFNEAPIHESGKYRRRRSSPDGNRRFNEAPIHESGKSLVDASGIFAVVQLQ